MIVSHRFRLIFVKTRKTAGTSVEIALSRHCGPRAVITPISPDDEATRTREGGRGPQNHRIPLRAMTRAAVSRGLSDRVWPTLYNHYPARGIRRVVGMRRWRRYRTFTIERNPWDRAVSLFFYKAQWGPLRFGDFLENDPDVPNFPLYSEDGEIIVDRVLRFERLPDDLAGLWADAGLPGEPRLPRAKSGIRPPSTRDFRTMYNPDQVEVVARRCRREIEAFGYHFDDGG